MKADRSRISPPTWFTRSWLRTFRKCCPRLVFKEKPINTRAGGWFSVRIMPYRTFENRIDGVVITFTDISVSKKLEAVLRESEREMKAHFKQMTLAFALFKSMFKDGRW